MKEKAKLHPAWGIFAMCFIIQFGGGGILANSISIYNPYVCAEFGWTVASFTLHISITALTMAIFLPFAGKLITTMSAPARAMIGAMGAVSLFLCGTFTQLWQWYIASAIRGITGAFLFNAIVPIVVRQWFVKKQGTAIGFAMAGSGIGGALMTQVGQRLITLFGWRVAIMAMGAISFILVVPTLWALTTNPEKKGLHPYGWEESEQPAATVTAAPQSSYGFLKNPMFYLLALIIFCGGLPMMLVAHLPQYARSLGSAAEVGALLASASLVGNVVWKIGMGNLNDHLKTRNTQLLSATLQFIGLLLLFMGRSTVTLVLGAFLFGNMYALVTVLFSLVVSDTLPAEQYNTGYSTLMVVMSVTNSIGTVLAGRVYDATGGYAACFIIALVSQVVLAALTIATYRIIGKKKAAAQAE